VRAYRRWGWSIRALDYAPFAIVLLISSVATP
jgi:hypothetical protein